MNYTISITLFTIPANCLLVDYYIVYKLYNSCCIVTYYDYSMYLAIHVQWAAGVTMCV